MNDYLTKPWKLTADEVRQQLDVGADTGLDQNEVKARRKRFGSNTLSEQQIPGAWQILVRQFKNLIILLLAAAAAISFFLQDWLEGAAIIFAVVINTMIGFFTELAATRSIASLKTLTQVTARLRRGGEVQEIPAKDIVPGDIVLLEAGNIVPADLRITSADKLRVDESALTGESMPVFKSSDPLEEGEPALGDRENMVFKGTAVSQGSGIGVAVYTGDQTQLGEISALAQGAGAEEGSHLEQRLNALAGRLIWIMLAIAAVLIVIGLLSGRELGLTLKTAIALMVAAVPEGLPIVSTIGLAYGMWRLARKNALIHHLSAVETLGSTTVICTDKTGTLTENRMSVTRILHSGGEWSVEEGEVPAEDSLLTIAVKIGVLCNNAVLPDGGQKEQGDPMEVALLRVGRDAGYSRQDLLKDAPEEREEPFTRETKMMATFHRQGERFYTAVKGAPEAVLECCTRVRTSEGEQQLSTEDKQYWLDKADELAAQGLRLLAAAERVAGSRDADPYQDLVLVGLLCLEDPPRQDVRDSIDACQAAGIRVVMVTGDYGPTAQSVGLQTGLIDDTQGAVITGKELEDLEHAAGEQKDRFLSAAIYSRVSPRHKLQLIQLHQDAGSVVAMTGDGINDAPALQKADIGIAMGQRGTQVAREASDMILKDDAFQTIVTAIAQGRAIFENIRKFIIFLLSGNISEILVVAAAMMAGLPLPLLPLQILYLNMIGDVFPALALGVGKGSGRTMDHPPRDPAEPILTRRHWMRVAGLGVVIAVCVMAAFLLSLFYFDSPEPRAVTVGFLTLAFSRLWLVFVMKDHSEGMIHNQITRNPFVWLALLVCAGLLLLGIFVPVLADVLSLVIPTGRDWLLIMGLSLFTLLPEKIVSDLTNN
ncbi:MAG: cation-translocating P-type ATPase [Candidatus Omnitrophota bacterium]